MVGAVERSDSSTDPLSRLRTPDFDPETTLLLPRGPGPARAGTPASAAAEILVDEPHAVEVRTNAPFDGYLVLADTYYSGWKARVDDEPVAIEPAYGLFRAVPVPAGEHRVSFRYEPVPFRVGAALGVVGLLAPWMLLVIPRRRSSP